jgi:hypothetical protein
LEGNLNSDLSYLITTVIKKRWNKVHFRGSNDIYFFLIDDAEMMLTKMEPQQKKIRLSLRYTRRAFTNDNEDG